MRGLFVGLCFTMPVFWLELCASFVECQCLSEVCDISYDGRKWQIGQIGDTERGNCVPDTDEVDVDVLGCALSRKGLLVFRWCASNHIDVAFSEFGFRVGFDGIGVDLPCSEGGKSAKSDRLRRKELTEESERDCLLAAVQSSKRALVAILKTGPFDSPWPTCLPMLEQHMHLARIQR